MTRIQELVKLHIVPIVACIVASILIILIRVVKPEENLIHGLVCILDDVKTSIAKLLSLQSKTESTFSKYLNIYEYM